MLKNKLVIRFQEVHLEKYNQTISYDEAEFQLNELATLVHLTTPNSAGGSYAEAI